MEFKHNSILLKECAEFLINDVNGIYVDCTLGGAGHSCAFAAKLSSQGTMVGIDQDADAIAVASERLKNKFLCHINIVRANFKDFVQILDGLGIGQVQGMFFDLGVSSYQLDNGARGFSYMHDGPLDMRMDQGQDLTASKIVNTYSEQSLAELIWRYGEERWAKRIAAFIAEQRRQCPIETTGGLVEIIKRAIPKGARQDGPHPAKRTFQAIRIEVNNELGILEETIEKAVNRLAHGGRIGVLTFHSLEDRIVKQVLARLHKGCTCPSHLPCVCGKKPILQKVGSLKPGTEEIAFNPRSRSARLRYGIKV